MAGTRWHSWLNLHSPIRPLLSSSPHPKGLRLHFPNHGEFYRVSLKTNDVREVGVRYAAENARLEKVFRNARLQQSRNYSLTLQDALQVASRWGSTELERTGSSGDFTPYQVDTRDGKYETISEAYDHHSPTSVLESNTLLLPHREALKASISIELTKVSLAMPQPGISFHGFSHDAFLIKHPELSLLAYKRSQGNLAAHLPLRPTLPLTIERATHEAPPKKLSAVLQQWSRYYLNIGDDKRDVKKLVANIRRRSSASSHCLATCRLNKSNARRSKTSEDFFDRCRPGAQES